MSVLHDIPPSTFSIDLKYNTKRANNLLPVFMHGAFWHAKFVYENLTEEEKGKIIAYASSIQNTTINVPVYQKRLGSTGLGTITALGSSYASTGDIQYDSAILSNVPSLVEVGDYFRIGDKLKVVTSKSSVSITFAPPHNTNISTTYYTDETPYFKGQLKNAVSFSTSEFASNITLEFEEVV